MENKIFKLALKKCGNSQIEIARRLGISKQAVHQWKTGQRPIPQNKVDIIKSW